jgi:hypothetical protein
MVSRKQTIEKLFDVPDWDFDADEIWYSEVDFDEDPYGVGDEALTAELDDFIAIEEDSAARRIYG